MYTAGMATVQDTTTTTTMVGDLPESCLAQAIALTSPRDACRCAAVSPSFRDAADSDAVWDRFLPTDYRAILQRCSGRPPPSSKKDAYLRLSDGANLLVDDDGGGGGGVGVWLSRESGARCVALSARKLSLPWHDGEFSWRWTPHPLSRFADVAQLLNTTELDIYGRLPTTALTPETEYAAYLVFAAVEGHRGLSFPDQETTVTADGRTPCCQVVCLFPDGPEAHKFMGIVHGDVRRPTRRDDGWLEMEMGRLYVDEATVAIPTGKEVAVSFEVLGWYPKRGLIIEGIEFRPV